MGYGGGGDGGDGGGGGGGDGGGGGQSTVEPLKTETPRDRPKCPS